MAARNSRDAAVLVPIILVGRIRRKEDLVSRLAAGHVELGYRRVMIREPDKLRAVLDK
jgi:hypothetical protein